ncbi:MAG: co-chaperone GroES [Thiofilum sp.]|uniref:co-chaperone GroES n=1 Tax=Thiofilum sp. TaxID=2212733 RepID=UPI0025DBAF52|nr:co-chaperone GroES [Thiofilum sp.]MBK8451960.1 co-chaperone GroES [Thiofilum sp.]
MNIRPLHDRVVVRRLEEERKTAGGIIIPDNATEKPDRGQVLATGPGKLGNDNQRAPLQVREGDTVLFGKYAGTTVRVNGEELLIMREEDILAVIEA